MELADYLLGLGSNVEPRRNARLMIEALLELCGRVELSRIRWTDPVGLADQPARFLNFAALVRSTLPPAEFKAACNAIDERLGRDRSDPDRSVRNRPADIDLLLVLQPGASEVAAGDLPTESYLAPQVREVLAGRGIAVVDEGADEDGGTAGAGVFTGDGDDRTRGFPAGTSGEGADGDAGVCPVELGGVTIGEVPLILERDQAGGVTVIRQSTGPARGALPEEGSAPVALVTGGAIRLGRALTLGLAAAGYDIVLHFHSSVEAAAATAAEVRALGRRCQVEPADLSDVAALDDLLARAAAAFGRLDVLVNSASAYTQARIADTTLEMFAGQFDVNLRAPFFLTQAFAAQVGRGAVINIIDNKIGFHQYAYAAYLLSKKSLAEFTRMAAVEFAPEIRVNAVAPGVVLPASRRSDEYVAWRVAGIPLARQGDPDDIVAAVLSLLGNSFLTGQVLVVDGGESLAGVGRNAADFDQDKV